MSAANFDPTTTLPPADPAATLPPAQHTSSADKVTVPGYEIVAELGRGGMGVVYQARQIGLNRDVALKMVLSGGHASATDLARFKSEAEAVAKLQHPNVVQIYEVGEAGGLPYFSLEYCSGGSLEKLLAGAPQPPREAAALIETLARAVHAAHQSGIIHRDLKPANILLSLVPCPLSLARHEGTPVLQGTKDQGQGTVPKITDFGLAKQIDSGSGRTASGAILGTPSYMAPEQANGSKEIGPAADTYALGAIFYELLTGRPPFRAATPLDTVLQVVGTEPVPPTRLNPQVPRDLETIALKCLQKEPAKRYGSAAELADDLHRWQAGEPIAARPAGAVEKAVKWAKRRPAVVGLAAAVVVALAVGFAGVLYELRIANDARSRAETQEGLAKQRANDLSKEQVRVRNELHQSDLLRADLLLQGNEPARAEQVLWRTYFTRPDDDDKRAYWRLWDLYRQRPRRSGAWIGAWGVQSLSPDGRRLALVEGSQVTICNAATGLVQNTFKAPQAQLFGVFFDRSGSRLGLLSAADGSVTIWDLDPAPVLRAALHSTGSSRPGMTMALGAAIVGFSQEQLRQTQRTLAFAQTEMCFLDGDRVLVADVNSSTLWKLDGPSVLTRFELESPGMLSFALAGQVVMPAAVVGDTIPVVRSGAVQLWELSRTAGGPISRTQLDFTDPVKFRRGPPVAPKSTFGAAVLGGDPGNLVSAAILSPDGKWLITERNRLLQVWDVATGVRRSEVQDGSPSYSPTKIAVTSDNAILRSIDKDGIRLWRLPGLEPVRTIPRLGTGGYVQFASCSADGRQTCVGEDKIVAIYDHQPAEAVRSLLPPNLREQFSSRKDVAASGPVIGDAFDGIAVWGDGRADRIPTSRNFGGGTGHTLLNTFGTAAVNVQSGIFSSNITVFDLLTRRAIVSFPLRDPERGSIRIVASAGLISPDGHTVIVGTLNSQLFVDLTAKKVVRAVRSERYMGVMFTPDSRAILCRNTPDNALVLRDVADDRELARAPCGVSEGAVAFSSDGALLLTGRKRRLVLRNGGTLAEVGEIPSTAIEINTGGFAPDGRLFAAGSQDGKLRLWDIARREEMVAIDLGVGAISKIVFTPDGRKVRFIAEKQVGEFDLHAYDPYVEGNLTWNLLRLLPELDRTEADRVLERLRDTHPDAYRAGSAALNAAKGSGSQTGGTP